MLLMTEASQEALAMLRDSGNLRWYVVVLLGLVIYAYAIEFERQRWDVAAAGAAFFLVDVFNELVNSAVLHITQHSALWTITGETAYLILVGWNIEIITLFLISGLAFVKFLPADRQMKIFGIPNRWALVAGFSCFAVFVEVLLKRAGIFHWEYWFWDEPFLLPIIVFGYATFFAAAAWVFDMDSHQRRVRVLAVMAAVDVVLAVALGIAGWL